jgi:hypothetical protein
MVYIMEILGNTIITKEIMIINNEDYINSNTYSLDQNEN